MMNELIKDFAKEAGAGRRAGINGLVFREEELEKFVELIVEKCFDQTRLNYPYGVGVCSQSVKKWIEK